jgi:hypothetical protein
MTGGKYFIKLYVVTVNMAFFYNEELIAHCPFPKLEDLGLD